MYKHLNFNCLKLGEFSLSLSTKLDASVEHLKLHGFKAQVHIIFFSHIAIWTEIALYLFLNDTDGFNINIV